MTASARDVAAALRERLPGLATKKLHKLLYYCQGHHLAAFDEPLFTESISAWDMGPVVGELWKDEKDGVLTGSHLQLSEAELNTVGYVLSRYGGLSGHDLEILTHGETPWQTADKSRRPKGTVRIEREWMRDYFQASALVDNDDDDVRLDSAAVTRWLSQVGFRQEEPLSADSPELIKGRLARGA